MSAGLAASTVTPGSTAPVVSLTSPARVACAAATPGTAATSPNNRKHLATVRMVTYISAAVTPTVKCYCPWFVPGRGLSRYALRVRYLGIFHYGGVSVSKKHRSFLPSSLVPAFLLVSVFAVVHAQERRSPSARQSRWSDAATWPDQRVPREGDKVTIAAGKDVVLDV